MKTILRLTTILFALFSLPAMAHIGPEEPVHHFIEHLFLVAIIGLPLGYALYRLISGNRDQRNR